jgi:hypothetical protein
VSANTKRVFDQKHGVWLDVKTLPTGTKPASKVPPRERHIGCPLWWFEAALTATRGAKEFAVAIYIWRLRVVSRSKTVEASNAELRKLGIDRHTKYRAVRRLADAKLVQSRRRGNSSLEITFLR